MSFDESATSRHDEVGRPPNPTRLRAWAWRNVELYCLLVGAIESAIVALISLFYRIVFHAQIDWVRSTAHGCAVATTLTVLPLYASLKTRQTRSKQSSLRGDSSR